MSTSFVDLFLLYACTNSDFNLDDLSINCVASIAIIVRGIALIYFTTHNVLVLLERRIPEMIVANILNVAYTIELDLFIFFDHGDLKNMKRLVVDLDQFLAEESKFKARIHDCFLFFIWIIVMAINLLIKYHFGYPINWQEIGNTFYLYGWFVARLLAYKSVAYRISLFEHQTYNETESNTNAITEQNGSIELINDSRIKIAKIVSFKQNLNSIHGFKFFLLPTHFVVATYSVLVFICGSGNLTFFKNVYPIDFFQYLLVIMVFFISIDYQEKKKPNFDQLLRSLWLKELQDEMPVRLLEPQIANFKKTTLTISNVFEISLNTILAISIQFLILLIHIKIVSYSSI